MTRFISHLLFAGGGSGIAKDVMGTHETQMVSTATRRRIPVLINNLLKERRVKRDSPELQKKATPTTMMTTTPMMVHKQSQ